MAHTVVIGNAHDDPTAVAQMIGAGDFLILNEVRSRAAKQLRQVGWAYYRPPGVGAQNPHMWRTSKFDVATKDRTWKQIMRGGRRGLADVRVTPRLKRRYRGRRLGPGRGATATLCTEKGGGTGIYVGVHMPARVFTSERWRLPVWLSAVHQLDLWLAALERAHPGVPVIVGGDMNKDGRIPLPVRYMRMNTMPDMGGKEYTQMYVCHNGGRANISRITEQRNASDHDAVVATVEFKDAA